MPYAFDPRLPYASTIPSQYYIERRFLDEENRTVFGRTFVAAQQ